MASRLPERRIAGNINSNWFFLLSTDLWTVTGLSVGVWRHSEVWRQFRQIADCQNHRGRHQRQRPHLSQRGDHSQRTGVSSPSFGNSHFRCSGSWFWSQRYYQVIMYLHLKKFKTSVWHYKGQIVGAGFKHFILTRPCIPCSSLNREV